MNITGRIYGIGQIQSIATKNGSTLQKREVILDTTRFDPYTGERGFENYPMFEFSGEKCKDLDGYKVGDVVTIFFDLQGGFYEASDGVKKNFTKVRGYKIEARQTIQPMSQQPVQQQAAQPQHQQPAPQTQSAPRYAPQYAQSQYPQPTPPPPGINDLPFPV
jgi:hypothetical protein